MRKLASVDGDALRETLQETTDAKAAKRLLVALCYKDGEAVSTLSDRFGIPRSTIYFWLDRFENEPLAEAIQDETRPGRPPKLDDEELAGFRDTVAGPPSNAGLDAADWTPELAQEYIRDTFGVEYSLGHVRRLLRNAH